MKRIFIMWLCSLISSLCIGQIITIVDDQTGMPVELAVISGDMQKNIVLTNHQGQADVSPFQSSTRIEIKSLGYQKQQMSFAQLKELNFRLQLKRDDISLDQVVVSATRWNQTSRDIPSKVSSIAAQDIALQNPQTAADLLGSSGEVFIQKSQQGGGSPMIRGFATNRLLYAVDGVRMNTAIFRGGNIQNIINLDPFATERVEVLFGPGSVIYGSDAIGGVMSFQTLSPQISLDEKPYITGKAVMRTSSANREATGHFDVNVGWKKWAFVSSFSSFDFGDLRMGRFGPEEYLRPFYVQRQDQKDVIIASDDPLIQSPSAYSQINLMQKIRFRPSDAWDLQYALHYSTTSPYERYDRHLLLKNGLPRYGEWHYGPQSWAMNHLTIRHTSYNNIYDEVVLRLAYQSFEESRIDRNLNAATRHIRTENVDAISANLDFSKALGKKNQFFYGLEGVWNDVKSEGLDEDVIMGTKAEGPSRYPQATWSSIGAYGNLHHRINDEFLFQAGLRYNIFGLDAEFDTRFYPFPYTTSSFNQGALTGSLGITFSPTLKWTFRVNGSTGFRSPNVDDSGKVFDSEPGLVVVPNPDLEAEYAYNVEAGIAGVLSDWFKVDLTGYYTTLDHALVRRDFTFNGLDSIMYDGQLSRVQAIQNAAVATVYGVQAGIDIQLPKGFGLTADVNYQKGTEELDDGTKNPSRHAPPVFGMSQLSYKNDGLSMVFYITYVGQKDFEELAPEEQTKTEIYAVDEQGRPYSPSWLTLNFKANLHLNQTFMIGAGLENMTDRRYRPYSSGMTGPGRNVILSLQANF